MFGVHRMTVARAIAPLVGLLFASAIVTAAEPPTDPAPADTKIVLKLSRAFLDKLTRQRIERDEPIRTASMGATVTGTAHVSGDFTVVPQTSDSKIAFDLRVDGTITTRVGVARRPVNVSLHGSSPLRTSRRYVFDGTAFVGQPVCVSLCYHSGLDGVSTTRRGPLAPLVRRVARNAVVRQLPAADESAERSLRASVAAAAYRETDRVAGVLNAVVGLQTDTAELLGSMGVRVDRRRLALATTDDAVLAGIGYAPGETLRLPARRGPQAPVEIWVYHPLTPSQELLAALILPKVDRMWTETIQPRIRDRLAAHSPDLAKFFDAARHEVLLKPLPDRPDWHLVRVTWPESVTWSPR